MTVLSETIVELIEQGLGDSGAGSPSIGEDLGLRPVGVDIEDVDLNMVPSRLRELFVFRSDLAVAPAKQFRAKSVCVGVFAVRLDKDGNLTYASPSIRNAAFAKESKYLPCGEWGKNAVVKPDLFVEAEFYGDDDLVVPVPVMYREPFNRKGEDRPAVSMQLSTANRTVDNWSDYHDAARQQFTELMNDLADELGVAAGEQFLVCMVGFPQYTKSFDGVDGQPFWGAAFNGAYLVGGRKVGSSTALATGLNKLRVRADLMVGGKSLKEKLAEEVMQARSRREVGIPTPKVERRMPTVATKVAETPLPQKSKVEVTANTQTPVTQPTATQMTSAAILEKLQHLSVEEDDEFQLMDIETASSGVADDDYCEESEEDVEEPIESMPIGNISKRPNPFA
ncbi:hypothetical protein OsccyDRAFT_0660 [Leptolyngbyaceae cyanobacterium JSC-12]|nr:hypothetical protein OsccyDRAFT_0660 [Leptolyngbyaceae cyanobacterium JSC-12]